MEKIDIVNTFAKMLLNIFFVYLVYIKITSCKQVFATDIILLIMSAIMSMLYTATIQFIYPLAIILCIYIIFAIIISMIIKNKINYIAYIISFAISYAMYLISVLISGTILRLCIPNINSKTAISLITIPLIETLLFYIIFRIKRFKNGFNFLKNIKINENLVKFIIVFTLTTIVIFGLLQGKNNIAINTCIFAGTLLIAISLIIWIKTQITKTYKSKMRDRTIEIQKTEIDEQTKLIEEIKAENLKLATAVHKYNSKFESLEHAMKRTLSLDSKTEFANEISVILKESEETLRNFAKEVEVNTNKLPLTNIAGIDKMFKYMQEEAAKNNINFDLKINESINPLIENIIPKEKFEILIGDHLKDAIIAIKASKATYKSILVTLGLVEGIYEFSIYDTGIEFEIDTLLKLGEEQVTTHKNEGGSGIGFMTTFETLKECKASLVIEEYNPETTNYTKSVTIKFDGKNEYKICSYRAEKIKEQKPKRRIIIEKMK